MMFVRPHLFSQQFNLFIAQAPHVWFVVHLFYSLLYDTFTTNQTSRVWATIPFHRQSCLSLVHSRLRLMCSRNLFHHRFGCWYLLDCFLWTFWPFFRFLFVFFVIFVSDNVRYTKLASSSSSSLMSDDDDTIATHWQPRFCTTDLQTSFVTNFAATGNDKPRTSQSSWMLSSHLFLGLPFCPVPLTCLCKTTYG